MKCSLTNLNEVNAGVAMFTPTVIDGLYRHLCGPDMYKICFLDFDVINVLHNFTETQ